jgi:hypothetical protein
LKEINGEESRRQGGGIGRERQRRMKEGTHGEVG